MSPADPRRPHRRAFLETFGLGALALSLGDEGSAADSVPDPAPSPTGADLGTLWPTLEQLAATQPFSESFLSGRFPSFDAFRTSARDRIFDLLRYRPEPVDPAPRVLERVDCGDYTREKILFSTAPYFRVPAYVLVPKQRTGRGPAIVDLHSHGGMFLFGKEKVLDLGSETHPAMVAYHRENYDGRPTATALVRRGYVVITIDALMFGERRVLMDADLKSGWDRSGYGEDTVRRLNQTCRTKESTLVKALVLAGMTWPGIVFRDDMRTVDYLASRPEVDPERIGCLGISMGGYRALFLTALDPRIRAGCVAGFMSTVRPMIRAHLDTHSWVHFLPELHRYLDWPDVASLAAPRGLFVQQCAHDGLFPATGMKEAVDAIAGLFAKGGAADRFVGRFYDTPHRFTRGMQEDAFDWLDRELGRR